MTDYLIDIETVPGDAYPGMNLEEHVARLPPPPAPARLSKPESIAAWQADPVNRIEHYRSGVFRWAEVRIVCIGIASRDGARVLRCFDREDEAEVLGALPEILGSAGKSGAIWTWGDYDPRVIRTRLLDHRLPFGPFSLRGKPWDRRVSDLQALFAEAVTGSPRSITGISVNAACDFLGIDRSDNPISGADVLDRYIAEDYDSIADHCLADVRHEWAVLERLVEAG